MSILKNTNSGKGAIYPRVTFKYLKSLGWYDGVEGNVGNDREHGAIKRSLCDPKYGWNYKIHFEGDVCYVTLFFGQSTKNHSIGFYPVIIEFADELEMAMEYLRSNGKKERKLAEHLFATLKHSNGIVKEPRYK